MVKRTLEQIECDVCGREGERYTLSFPDGIKILDRCDRHDKKIQTLKEEAGDWSPVSPGNPRGKLVVTSLEEIERRRAEKE